LTWVCVVAMALVLSIVLAAKVTVLFVEAVVIYKVTTFLFRKVGSSPLPHDVVQFDNVRGHLVAIGRQEFGRSLLSAALGFLHGRSLSWRSATALECRRSLLQAYEASAWLVRDRAMRLRIARGG